jgi:hypothetical protein
MAFTPPHPRSAESPDDPEQLPDESEIDESDDPEPDEEPDGQPDPGLTPA